MYEESGRERMGFLRRVQQFFREVAVEFRLVRWPSRREVAASTVVVMTLVFLVAFFLWAVDVGLSWPVERLLRLGGRS